ncbi:MAG: Ig-like domain-containing protein, partial [Planctomycetes bacterium]|nr:Ig-like domain-containing protein [Planctomycetota bacterium]
MRTPCRIPVLAALAVAALAAAAPAWVHRLVPGQKAFGTIEEAGEIDEIEFFAEAGAALDFKFKARKGEALLPVVLSLEDPDGVDILDSLPVKTSAKGNLVRVGKFTAPETGVYTLALTGGESTTGTWDLQSKGPPTAFALSGTVAAAGAEVEHDLDFDAGTEIQVLVKPAPGSGLQPLMASLEGPGDATLADGLRKTTAKKDQVKKLVLDELGTWTLAVTGAAATTGAYTGTVKVGKAVALDFTEDPPDAPDPDPAPTVSSASPSSVEKPAAGTEERSLTVTGAHFEDGATVAITAPSGTNGISNVQAAFGSSTSLSVTFDLSSAASVGPRTVTVTNPDLRAGTKVSAFTVAAAPGFEVTAVTPSAGPATGGTRILVQGALFEPQATVTIGGKPAEAVLFVDQRNILCTVPPAASPSASEGTPVDVVVSNGGGDATLADGFTYEADVDRPSIASVVPAAGATGVATNLQKMVFVLDEPVLSANVIASNFHFFRSAASGVNDISSPSVVAQGLGPRNRFLVIQRGAATGGTLSTNSIYVGQVQNNNQTTNLITDPAGNALETPQFGTTFYQSSWTTGTTQDTTKPTVLSTGPAASATGVDVDRAPTIVFSEPVDPTTLAAAVTLKQGGTTVACDMDLDAACTTVVLTPRTKLAASTTYTIGVSTGLRDLALNALNTAFAASFTTAAADGTAPAQLVTVDDLPQEMNGSGTYAAGTSNGGTPSGSGAATAFDVYLPLSGFTVDVSFTDAGGSGVDPSSFTCTCSVAMGSVAAGQPLGPLFTVTPMGATWTVPSTHKLASGTNVVFTVGVSDYAGNASTASTLTVDAADIAKTIANANGNAGNDRDPFNSRQSWLLRFDQDIWTVSSASGGSGSHGKPIAVTTSLAGNGVADFREDLTLIGLNGTESGAGASSVTNSGATGTNAIVQKLVKEAVRGYLNQRWGIGYDGTRGADSVDIEFLLEGETKAAGGTVTPTGWTSGSGFSMMTFTGDERANANGGTIGRATLDFRNTGQENDSNTGNASGLNLGTFATHMIRVRLNDPEATDFPRTFDPLIATASRGGVPVGSSNDDAIVLAGTFDYGAANGARKARFDLIMTAIDRYALYLSSTGAHEIGHSTGLVPDGAPPAGLFGNAHPNSPFIDTANFTTTGHIDTPGPNLMEAASSFGDAIAT